MRCRTRRRRGSKLNGWLIVALILVAILLLLQVRIWVVGEYRKGGPLLQAGWGPVRVTLYPRKKKSEKALLRLQKKEEKRKQRMLKKAKPAEPKEEKKEARKIGETLELLWELLPVMKEAGRKFKGNLRIKELTIHLTWGGSDPADAAISYGAAQAVMAGVLPVLEANFKVKKTNAVIDMDYTIDKPNIYVKAALSITVMQALSLGLYAGRRAFGVYRAHRKKNKQIKEKAVK